MTTELNKNGSKDCVFEIHRPRMKLWAGTPENSRKKDEYVWGGHGGSCGKFCTLLHTEPRGLLERTE